jgi:PAS domain S-box-containing protein
VSDAANRSEEQKGAEAEVDSFRRHLGPFVVAAESTRMPMVFTNANAAGNPIIFANDSFLSLTGYDRAEVLGRNFDFLLAPGDNPEALAQLEAAFADPAGGLLEMPCRGKAGDLYWVAVFVGPVRDDTGEIVQHFASLVDITRHKQEEEHLRFLLSELNHRT